MSYFMKGVGDDDEIEMPPDFVGKDGTSSLLRLFGLDKLFGSSSPPAQPTLLHEPTGSTRVIPTAVTRPAPFPQTGMSPVAKIAALAGVAGVAYLLIKRRG